MLDFKSFQLWLVFPLVLDFKSFQSWVVFLLVLDFGFRPWLVLVVSQMDTVNREGTIIKLSTTEKRKNAQILIYST